MANEDSAMDSARTIQAASKKLCEKAETHVVLGGPRGGLVKDHTFYGFFLLHPSLS